LTAERAGRRRKPGPRNRSTPIPINAALRAFVTDIGIAPTLAMYDVITTWSEVVGEQIARVAVAERMENGILFVSVNSAPWRTELTMKRRAIVDKLNAHAGGAVVKDIRFR
jgi:predicted nucleic acid-binding Zn ribbon protein